MGSIKEQSLGATPRIEHVVRYKSRPAANRQIILALLSLAFAVTAEGSIPGVIWFEPATAQQYDLLRNACTFGSPFDKSDEVAIYPTYTFYRSGTECVGHGYDKYCRTYAAETEGNSCKVKFLSRGHPFQIDGWTLEGMNDPFVHLEGHELPLVFSTERKGLIIFNAKKQIKLLYDEDAAK